MVSAVIACNTKRWKKLSLFHKLLLIILLAGLLLFSKGLYMQSKALLAQQLLSFAWGRHMQDGELHKAWPWADSEPFAQLRIAGQDPLIVLAGASGSNLAFAPAWMVSSARFDRGGNSVLAGHNDTHFKMLKDIILGDELIVTTVLNSPLFFQVIDISIVNQSDLSVLHAQEQETVTLITCYPFDSHIINSDLRYVVVAKRIKDNRSSIDLARLEKAQKSVIKSNSPF
jgi:sortase A